MSTAEAASVSQCATTDSALAHDAQGSCPAARKAEMAGNLFQIVRLMLHL
jgi:hypothetical protein